MSVHLSITTKLSSNVDPKTYTNLRGNRKRVKEWNGEMFSYLATAGYRYSGKITVAGPPGCEDRPWWWGRGNSNSQEGEAR